MKGLNGGDFSCPVGAGMRRCWEYRHKPGLGFISTGFQPTLLIITILWLSTVSATGTNVVVQKEAQFDVTYNDTVMSDTQTIYAFNHTVSRNKSEGVRVSVQLITASPKSPVLFVVRQKQAVLSFQVPLILRGLDGKNYQYTQVERTFCQARALFPTETQLIYVDVSTLSSLGITYQLRVSHVDSFTLHSTADDINWAAEPIPANDTQGDGRWMSQHNHFLQECKDAEPEVVFFGDSIVQLMKQNEVWRDLFSPLHALNFGISGDTTSNVLWRLQNGELQNIRPKVVVVWVGTNNHQNTAEQVTGGVVAIVQLINSQQPQAKVVVLGLLPRGERPNPLREKNAAVNTSLRSLLPKLGPVQFLDVSADFVQSDGTILVRDMYDFLHPSAIGFHIIAKPLNELLLQLLEKTPDEKHASMV